MLSSSKSHSANILSFGALAPSYFFFFLDIVLAALVLDMLLHLSCHHYHNHRACRIRSHFIQLYKSRIVCRPKKIRPRYTIA